MNQVFIRRVLPIYENALNSVSIFFSKNQKKTTKITSYERESLFTVPLFEFPVGAEGKNNSKDKSQWLLIEKSEILA